MSPRDRAMLIVLLVIAVLGPTFFVAGLAARGLDLLDADIARVGVAFVVLALSAACAAFLAFRPGPGPLRAVCGVALLVNLGSVGIGGGLWLSEMERLKIEETLVPVEPVKAGILVAALDGSAASRREAAAIESAAEGIVRRAGLTDYVEVRHVPPVASEEHAQRLADKMRANVVVWKGRESLYQYQPEYRVTVVGANEAQVLLDPVPLLLLLTTHGTYQLETTDIVSADEVPDAATELVAPMAAGLAFMAIGRPRLGLDQFRTAAAHMGSTPHTRALLDNLGGLAYLDLGRDDLAEEAFRKVIADASHNASPGQSSHRSVAHTGLGSVYLSRRDWTVAKQEFQQALESDVYDPAPYCALGLLASREHDVQETMSLYYRAIALHPEESVPYVFLGSGFELVGDAQRAREAYRLAEYYAPPNAGLQLAAAERGADVLRNPPTAVPTATPLPIPTPTPIPEEKLYTVKSGDTLTSIAVELGVSMEELAKENEIKHADAIFIGQKLVIPNIED